VPRSVKAALSYFSAATAIGPWSGWMRRGFDQYLRGNYERSVGAYLHAAELGKTPLQLYISFADFSTAIVAVGRAGYEVAQSNAAYILRAKLKPHNNAPSPPVECSADNTSVGTCSVVDMWGNSSVLHDRLLSRLYKLSAHHGNRDSFLQLGTCHFKAQCGLSVVNYERALWYYSKASYLGSHLASAYLGVMYHFGLGTAVNPLRAGRYYALALEQDTEKSIASFVQSLKYALSVKDYYFMMPVNLGLDYVVRKLW
jgi:TPR repeat protein